MIMNICRNISEISFDILLFTNEKRYYDDEFEKLGGRIFRIPNYEGRNRFRKRLDYYIRFFRIFFGTKKILQEYGPYDVIHCHNFFESGICNFAAKLVGVKVRISHCHSTSPVKPVNLVRRFYDFILHLLIMYNTNVRIGCSKQAIKYIFGNDKKAFVVNNAIDLSKFDYKLYNYQDNNNIRFIHIGRYCSEKNQQFLLEVFKKIRAKKTNVRLILVGFGNDHDIIVDRIVNLGLSDSVQMFPPDSDLPRLLSDSDYLIFPSIREGLGIVLLEAQSMGVKCFVSTAVPPEANMGLCEYLDLKNGADFWADYIIDYIIKDNRSKRKHVLDDVLKKYDINKICEVYRKIYNSELLS